MMIYVGTALFLFMLGLYCLATRHNLIKQMMGIIILFTGANLNFIWLSFKGGMVNLLGQTIVITAIVLEGCVIAVGLAYVYAAYRQVGSLDVRKLRGG
jgi:NADH:ubiquinone oxidoreductase subunit K